MRLFKRVKRRETKASPKNAFDDPSSIGNILVKIGKITSDQLISALGEQAQFNDALLGALLVKTGVANNEDIAKALVIQQKMRDGKAVAAELDVLQAKVQECAAGEKELGRLIEDRRRRRRERGENSALFLISPSPMKG